MKRVTGDQNNGTFPDHRSGCYLGLSVSSTSVGWTVTDEQYNILKFKRKSTWDIHLFDRAESSEERQLFRTKRRRIDRRKWKLSLLNDLFEDAISTVDPDFLRLFSDEASYHSASGVTSFGKGHDDFPTVYHLRRHLMITPSSRNPLRPSTQSPPHEDR